MNDIPITGQPSFQTQVTADSNGQAPTLRPQAQYPARLDQALPSAVARALEQAIARGAREYPLPVEVRASDPTQGIQVRTAEGDVLILRPATQSQPLPQTGTQLILSFLTGGQKGQLYQALSFQLAPQGSALPLDPVSVAAQTTSTQPAFKVGQPLTLSAGGQQLPQPFSLPAKTPYTLPLKPVAPQNLSHVTAPQGGIQSAAGDLGGGASLPRVSSVAGWPAARGLNLAPTFIKAPALTQVPASTAPQGAITASKSVLTATKPSIPRGEAPLFAATGKPNNIPATHIIKGQSVSLGLSPPPSQLLTTARAGEQMMVISQVKSDGQAAIFRPSFAAPLQFQSAYNIGEGVLFSGRGQIPQGAEGSQIRLMPLQQNVTNAQQSLYPTFPDIPESMNSLKIWGGELFKAGPWPVLQDAAAELHTAQPALAQGLIASAPSPAQPAQMMPAMLFFMTALKGGDISSWIGERAMALLEKSGKSDLLSQLQKESDAMKRADRDGAGAEWRSYALPLAHGEDLFKMALHVRTGEDEGGNSDTSDDKSQTRFIFDLALPRIGDLQLDGLFQGAEQESRSTSYGRLDIVLRTKQSFSAAMRQDMRRMFAGALESSALQGEMHFSHDAQSWIRVQ